MNKIDAVMVLKRYPNLSVAAYYKGWDTDDAIFVRAVRCILGEEAEYPDYSWRKISYVIKFALDSIESNSSGTDQWQHMSAWIAEMRSGLKPTCRAVGG